MGPMKNVKKRKTRGEGERWEKGTGVWRGGEGRRGKEGKGGKKEEGRERICTEKVT